MVNDLSNDRSTACVPLPTYQDLRGRFLFLCIVYSPFVRSPTASIIFTDRSLYLSRQYKSDTLHGFIKEVSSPK